MFISADGVRSVWLRHGLERFSTRLTAIEAWIAAQGIILTDEQVIAMDRKKDKLEAIGEIETEHPCYLSSQDTYYVGNIKGVGRIYQQTFIDTPLWQGVITYFDEVFGQFNGHASVQHTSALAGGSRLEVLSFL